MAKSTARDLADFDAAKKAQEEGIEVQIMGPDGREPLGFSIRVAGPDSDLQRKASDRLANERLDRQDTSPLTAADLALARVRGLAMSTMGWGEFILDGATYPFNEENALKLYQRFPWMREQVEGPAGRRAAFLSGLKQGASAPSPGG